MEEEVEYCKNCKKHIPAKNYVIHSVHCDRNIQLCDRCSEPVPRSEIEAHLEEYHSLDTCSDCRVSLEKCQIEKHKETCPRKLVPCEFCELETPLDSLSVHSAACGSRTEKCLQCDKHVMIKDLQKHQIICSTRDPETMPCEFCDIQIPWNDFIEHNTMCGTRTERCYLCNEHVMASDRATHFETCRKHREKEKECSYCLKMFPYSSFGQHLETCQERPYTCEKCLRPVLYREKEHHLKYTCAAQARGFSTNDYMAPDVEIDDDKKIVRASKTNGTCPICHESVPWVDMNVHTACCAQVYYDVDDYTRQNQINEFVLKKGSEASNDINIERQLIQHFKQEKKCLYCLKMFPSSSFAQHLETCQERPYTCEKCLRPMRYREKENHLKYKCSIRERAGYPRNDYMPHDDAEAGDKSFVKLKKCNFCGKRFPDVLFQPHLHECELKQQKFQIGSKDVPTKDMEKHIFQKRTDSSGNSNSNYNRYVSIMEPPKNEDEKTYFEKNAETCPSCNCKIPKPKYDEHLYHCYSGKKPCHFCGLALSKDDEFMHMRYCPKILEIENAERNSKGTKNKNKKNEGKTVGERLMDRMSSWMSSKLKDGEMSNKSEKAFEPTPFMGTNRGNRYERSNMALMQSPVTQPMENIIPLLPCEFCNEMYPFESIIEHQSGCRPDLVSYPKTKEASDDSRGFAIAAASPETFRMLSLAASQERGNERNEWKIQSRRKNRTFDREKDDFISQNACERNRHQKQITPTDKFFYHPPQDMAEVPKKQKKRYPQSKESIETSKTKPVEEIGTICGEKESQNLNLDKNQFTSSKFTASGYNGNNDVFVKGSENGTNLKMKNDDLLSTNSNILKETTTRNSYSFQAFAAKSSSSVDDEAPNFQKAVNAERFEKSSNIFSRKDDSTLSSVNNDFKELSVEKRITFDENSRGSQPSKFLESTKLRTLNSDMPAIWNVDHSPDNDKTNRSAFVKSYLSNNNNENKSDIVCNSIENTDLNGLNPSMHIVSEASYNTMNDVTFGSNFRNSEVNKQNKEEKKYVISNSEEIFYDADDGSALCFDTADDKFHGNNNTPVEKLNHMDLGCLNFFGINQKANINHSNYKGLSAGIDLEEDLNNKDADLDCYFQYLHGNTKQSRKATENQTNETKNLSHWTFENCRHGNKSRCHECSASLEEASSTDTHSFEDASCIKSDIKPREIEQFGETKSSIQMRYEKSLSAIGSNKKAVDGNLASSEMKKWKMWRQAEKSDSE